MCRCAAEGELVCLGALTLKARLLAHRAIPYRTVGGAMKEGITEALARRAAAHLRRTFAISSGAVVVALALVAAALHGLTTSSTVSGKP
jgi:hypothetical protein